MIVNIQGEPGIQNQTSKIKLVCAMKLLCLCAPQIHVFNLYFTVSWYWRRDFDKQVSHENGVIVIRTITLGKGFQGVLRRYSY